MIEVTGTRDRAHTDRRIECAPETASALSTSAVRERSAPACPMSCLRVRSMGVGNERKARPVQEEKWCLKRKGM